MLKSYVSEYCVNVHTSLEERHTTQRVTEYRPAAIFLRDLNSKFGSLNSLGGGGYK